MGRLNEFYVKVTKENGQIVFVKAKFLVINDSAVRDNNADRAKLAEIYTGPSLDSVR